MAQAERVQVPLSNIRLGAASRQDIYDPQGTLLLARGQAFTRDVRELLTRREIHALDLTADEAQRLRIDGPSSKREKKTRKQRSSGSFRRQRINRGTSPLDAGRETKHRNRIVASAAAVYLAAQKLGHLGKTDLAQLCQIPDEMIDLLIDDCDQAYAVVSERKDPRVHLAQRCVRMSILAINTAIEMGLPERHWLTVGTAGLMHDLSLFQGPPSFRLPGSYMSRNERWRFRLHPRRTADTLCGYGMISEEVCVVMHQVHEQDDGRGYPRGLCFNALHPLSRILNLVDAYLALVEPSTGRHALLPHDAMRIIARETKLGRFRQDVADAFIDHMTHYPVGSEVELDDGNRAQVVRRDGAHRDTPIVQIFGERHTLRLRDADRSIKSAAKPYGSPEVPLSNGDIERLDWKSLVAA